MEARLKQSGVFQNLIYHLKEQAKGAHVGLRFDRDKIYMQQMDGSHVLLLELSLDPLKVFESYECNGLLEVGVELDVLSRIFQRQEEKAVKKLVIERDDDDPDYECLSVYTEFPDRFHQSDFTLISIEDDEVLNVPDTEWACTVTMPSRQFQSIVRQVFEVGRGEGYGAACMLRVSTEGIFFTVYVDEQWRFTKLLRYNRDVVVTGEPTENEDVPVSSLCLHYIVGKTCIAPQVSISVKSHDYPVQMRYDIEETTTTGEFEKCGSMKYFTAPKTPEYARPPLAIEREQRSFEAQLNESRAFVQLIEAVHKVVEEVEMILSENGIHFCTLDKHGVSCIAVSLSSDFFDSFRCSAPTRIGVDLTRLNWALQATGDECSLVLAVDEDGDILDVIAENSSKDEIAVHEIDACSVVERSFELPEHPYECTIAMPSKLYEKVVSELRGTTCTISITRAGILFEAENSRSILDTKHCAIKFDVKQPLTARFRLEYLKQFSTTTSFASVVTLSMSTRKPLKLEYRTDSESLIIKYLLAPFCDEDEDEYGILSASEVDSLSSRLQSCKDVVTDQQKSRAAKRPPVRKRKRADSKHKKPARKRNATRAKPKKCSVCKLLKSYEEYFPAQLSKTTRATCIDCMVVKYRGIMMAWQEPRTRGRREAARRREEVRCMRSLRCERYECPIFFEEGLNNLSENLQVSFMPMEPDLQELFGAYDLVFTSSDTRDVTYKQRAIAGELILESRKEGLLHGSFAISPVISEFMEPSARRFTVAQKTSGSSHTSEMPIQVLEPTTGGPEEGHSGAIRVLAKRTATGWFPHENPTHNRLISFDTVEEAEELVKRHEQAFLANSWINNHLSLPTELALKIHEYVAFRPPIAFFFEKGDLWITLWKGTNDESMLRTIFVARRREYINGELFDSKDDC